MPKTVILPPGTHTPIAPFSPGTYADGVVYVSGTLAFDKDNKITHVGDAEGQTRHILETIKSVIETAGGTMDDVTMNNIMLKSWDDYAAMNKSTVLSLITATMIRSRRPLCTRFTKNAVIA